MNAHADSRNDTRVAYLDSIRGVAALMVAGLWHYQHFSSEFQPGSLPLDQAPFFGSPLLAPGYLYGYFSVDAFFVLSGIVFYHVYWDRIRAGSVSGWQFFSFRFSRLYPIHLATLLLVAVLVWIFWWVERRFPIYLFNGPYYFFLNLLFLQRGFADHGQSFNGPAWSLSIEAFLYLLFFMLARLRLGMNTVLLLLGLGIMLWLSNMDLMFLLNKDIARGLVGFFWGMTIYRFAFRSDRSTLLLVSIPVAMAIVLYLHIVGFGHTALPTVWLSVALVIVAIRRWRFLRRFMELRPLTLMGDISLTVYMIHIPLQIIILLAFVVTRQPIPFNRPWFLLLYVGAVIGVAYVVHVRFELPAQQHLREVLKKDRVGDPRGKATT